MEQKGKNYSDSNDFCNGFENVTKRIKFDLYTNLFYCLQEFKSTYKYSENETLIATIFDNLFKSDPSYLYWVYFFQCKSSSNTFLGKECINYFNKIKLHHYTSMKAFDSITKSNSLLLSNIQDMNDSLESKFYFEMIMQDLRDKQSRSSEDLHNLTDLFYKKLNDVYVLSFSAEDDDAAQWERYADNGEGVCLVTPFNIISNWVIDKGLHYPFLCPVEYANHNEQLSLITNHLIEDYGKCINAIIESTKFTSSKILNKSLKLLVSDCCKIKERSFRNEKEFRLIVFEESENIQNGIYSKEYIPDKSRLIRQKIKFDKVFSKISQSDKALFSEVILGPKSKADPKVIQDYLRNERGLDVTVSKSNSSLR